MIDGIIKADGTSRLMRATLPATYEEFRAQCRDGAQPLDILFNALGWSQLPTFLNKGNLASDNTLALFGLGADSAPNDVFGVLSRFQNGFGNEYVWAKYGLVYEPVWGAEGHSYFSGYEIATTTNPTLVLYSSLSYANGEWVLSDQYKTVTVSPSNITTVLPTESLNVGVKYFKDTGGNVWKTTPGASRGSYNSNGNLWTPYITNSSKLTKTAENPNGISYVNSPDPNAYPVDDGYTYTPLGQLGNKVQIATGSYTGTGTYGASNPNGLMFDFDVKALVVRSPGGGSDGNGFIMLGTGTTGVEGDTGGAYQVTATSFGNVVTWYGTQDAGKQMNLSGATYRYIAIG